MVQKKLKITVAGQAYEVEVEVLSEPSTLPPPAPLTAPLRAAIPPSPQPSAGFQDPPPPQTGGPAGEGIVPAPLAGLLVSVDAKIGDAVTTDQKVMTLEAMKMETVVSAPCSGTIKEIFVKKGDAIGEGQPLFRIG